MLLPRTSIRKSLVTRAARVRFLPRVYPRVHDHVLLQREPLPAILTLERSLPGVRLHVRLQVRRLREILQADHANVGPLPRVHPPVIDQRGGLCEPPSALAAHVRFLPGVRPHVQLEGDFCFQVFSAVVAEETLVAGVNFHVWI